MRFLETLVGCDRLSAMRSAGGISHDESAGWIAVWGVFGGT